MAKMAQLQTHQPPSNKEAAEEEDFCIICFAGMPLKLIRFNSIECNECKRAVHLKCADITAGFYTCVHCTSD